MNFLETDRLRLRPQQLILIHFISIFDRVGMPPLKPWYIYSRLPPAFLMAFTSVLSFSHSIVLESRRSFGSLHAP